MREKGKLHVLSQVHGSAFEIVWDSRGRKAEGAEYRKGQRNRLEPEVCLLAVCARAPAVRSPWPCAFCRGRSVLAQQGTGCRSCLALVLFSCLFPILSFMRYDQTWKQIVRSLRGPLLWMMHLQTWKGAHTVLFPVHVL